MAEEIKYIPYGLDEISQAELLTALANDLPNFINRYKWLLKPKNRDTFLKIYSDIVNGLTGASNDSGLWSINTSNDMNSYLMSPREKEIAEHAAYYIQLQMAKITPKAKAEEAKKENLDKFNFLESFGKQLLNLYGGDPKIFGDSEQGWNSLDARGADGLRGTSKRKEKMAELLDLYRQELANGKDYNFEGTSFKDKQDALTKLLAAIDALRNTPNDESDDLPAFSALGLNYRNFFSNGGNEELILEDGTKTTYSQYNQAQKKKLEDEAKAKAELAKLQRANQYDGYKYYDLSKFNGRPLTALESSVEYLNNLIAKDKWTGDEASQIVQAFKLAEKNGQLVPITDKNELSKFSSMWKNRTKQLRKINGIEGIYYDTVGKKFVKPYKNGQTPQTSFLDILNLNNPEAIAKKKLTQLAKQMNSPILGSLDLSDLSNFGFDEATGNELWAVINDIGAFVDPEAISGTALALNAARLRDKNRDGWSWERILDWGTSALGGLPVIGDAASVVKAGSNLVKLANRSARVGSFIGMAFSAVNMPEAWDSIKKIYNKGITSMTPQDILNITYGLMGLFAGIKTINSVNARQKPQTTTEHSIEIDGKKIKLPDQATADKISAEYKAAKNNTEASLKVVKMQEVREAAKKAGIEVTDASKVTSGSGFLRGNLVSRKLGMGKSPVKSELVYTGEMTGGSTGGYYMPSWRRSFLNLEQKEIRNPLRKTFDWFLGRTPEVKSTETSKPTSEAPKTTGKRTWAEIEKGPKKWSQSTEAKEYREMLKGNYSNNAIQGGTHKIGDMTFDVEVPRPGATNGFVEVTFKNGNKETIRFDTQKQLLERISKIIKDNRVLTTTSEKTKIDAKEMGKILKSLKARGLLKHGGKVEPSLDKIIEDFIKNNNI